MPNKRVIGAGPVSKKKYFIVEKNVLFCFSVHCCKNRYVFTAIKCLSQRIDGVVLFADLSSFTSNYFVWDK